MSVWVNCMDSLSLASGLATIENRFVIEGHYKYTFNNGHLAMADPKAAATNFLNALEKIPGIISQRKEKNEALAKDIPQLQEIAGKVWKKEDELKQLKSELATLDRKIQLELVQNNPVQECVKEEQTDNGISNNGKNEILTEKLSPVLSSSEKQEVNSYKGFRL